MRTKVVRAGVWIIVLAALSTFVWTLVHATLYAPEREIALPTPPATAASSALPVRLVIPALHVDAAVQQVGIKTDGSMGTPSNFTDVAWYKYGTVPGQIGSAVIDGHVDNGLSLPGVFKHLGDLKVGDSVYIRQKDGSTIHFLVEEIESYQYKNVPLQMLFARSDAARLNLVTCEGNWVKGERTYDQRLVVFTKLVSS